MRGRLTTTPFKDTLKLGGRGRIGIPNLVYLIWLTQLGTRSFSFGSRQRRLAQTIALTSTFKPESVDAVHKRERECQECGDFFEVEEGDTSKKCFACGLHPTLWDDPDEEEKE